MPCSGCGGTGKQKCVKCGGKVHILMILVVLVEEMDILLAQDVMDAVNLF